MILRKIYIYYKVWCGMVCCMMWNVCGLDGLQSVNGVMKKSVRGKMVVWNGGVKVRCGVECHGVILNALWYGYLRFSVQSSLLFLYYVVFSVTSVQYCLCVSRFQFTQCSMSVHSVGSVLQRSMQVVFRVAFVKHSVYRVECIHCQWCSVLAGFTVYGIHGLPAIIQCR